MKKSLITLAVLALIAMVILNSQRANAQVGGSVCYNPDTGATISIGALGRCPAGWEKI